MQKPTLFAGSSNDYHRIDVPDSLVGSTPTSISSEQNDNAIDTNANILETLRNDIKEEEDIARKSAALLQLLEV